MRFLAEYVMRGRLSAILVAAVTGMGALPLPPLSYLSGAVVGLVTLRLGLAQGMMIAGGALLALSLLGQLLLGTPLMGAALFAVLWLPVALAAEQLRRSVRLERALWLFLGLALALLGLIHMVLGDPAAWWRELLGSLLSEAGETITPELSAALDETARLMSGAMAAGFLLSAAGSLLLARWWQALLYNPGGFRTEFQALRLGRLASMAVFVVMAVGTLLGGTVASALEQLLLPLLALYLLQGLALVHGLVGARGAHVGWLVLMYALLLIAMPQTALTLALAGWVDNWVDFRALLGRKTEE